MNDNALFLRKFLTQIARGNPIASVAPSSRWLSRTTVRNIDWDRAETLVELGAGTGPITRVLAERARPDCRAAAQALSAVANDSQLGGEDMQLYIFLRFFLFAPKFAQS